MKDYPMGGALGIVFMLTIFLSVVTLADSMTTTVSSLSIQEKNTGTKEPPKNIKIFWGLVMSSLALTNIVGAARGGEISGIDATKQLAIVSAFPLLFIMLLLVLSCVKTLLKNEEYALADAPTGNELSENTASVYRQKDA